MACIKCLLGAYYQEFNKEEYRRSTGDLQEMEGFESNLFAYYVLQIKS